MRPDQRELPAFLQRQDRLSVAVLEQNRRLTRRLRETGRFVGEISLRLSRACLDKNDHFEHKKWKKKEDRFLTSSIEA